MGTERITRDHLFMGMAHLLAQRSTCERGQVGAVIVRDRRVISSGYNGAPPGMPHCTEVGCKLDPIEELASVGARMSGKPALTSLGCQRTIHAEANAIVWAARHGIATEGAVMFCTYSPCRQCAELAHSAGIVELIYDKNYRATPWDLLEEMGMNHRGVDYATQS
jgi:dCMP deaminase